MFDLMSIIFIVIILLMGIIGYFKGFCSLLLSLAKGVLATFVASLLCNPLGSLIYSTGLGNTISNSVNSSLVEQNEIYLVEITSETETLIYDQYINDAVNTMKVPGVLKGSIQDIIDNRDRLEAGESTTLGKIIGDGVGDFVCTTIAFLLLVLALFIVFSLLQRLFKNINIIPVVGPLNRVLGGLTGIVLAFLFIGFCCYIISFIISLQGDLSHKLSDLMGITPGAEKDTFARFCYDYNVLRWLYRLIF